MDAQTQAKLLEHIEGLGQILYAEADKANLRSLEGYGMLIQFSS